MSRRATTVFQARTLATLQAMSLEQVNTLSGLAVSTSSPQWEGIVDAVRGAIDYGNTRGFWSEDEQCCYGVHETADFLVPTKVSQRAWEFAAIGGAWRLDLKPFEVYALVYRGWRNTDLPDLENHTTVDAVIGRALYLAYTSGLRNVLRHLFELEGRLSGAANVGRVPGQPQES